jgi:hypothetical protein
MNPRFFASPFILFAAIATGHAAGWSFSEQAEHRDVLFDGRPVLRHMNVWDPARREETSKPYLHVFAFDGKTLLTKGPGGKFTHHRGAFIGWNKTGFGGREFDFWHCRTVERRHKQYLKAEEIADASQARMVSATEWPAPDGKVVIAEKQTVTARQLGAGRLQLDFAFELRAPSGKVKLGGDAQHAGFHYRAPLEVEQNEKTTKYDRPGTASGGKNDLWENCPWVVCNFDVAGKRYAVMHMSAPANPVPMVYSTRAYGRFGSFFTAEIAPEKPLVLHYRLLVTELSVAPAGDWAARYSEWVATLGKGSAASGVR